MTSDLLIWLGLLSAIIFVVSLATLPWLVAAIPADYFSNPKAHRPASTLSAGALVQRVLKNLLGLVLLVGGFMMLFMPGQGLLTMLAGAILMDYPGKYQLERRLVSIPAVLSALNWLRQKRHAPPLVIDQHPAHARTDKS